VSTPRVAIDIVDVVRAGDRWRMSWRITSDVPLRLISAAAPHGRLHAADVQVDLGTPADLALDVRCDDAPDTDIENTFLILIAAADPRPWRILARMRVHIGGDGVPRPMVERVDVQEVGFSGQR